LKINGIKKIKAAIVSFSPLNIRVTISKILLEEISKTIKRKEKYLPIN
jgi:hypothetical protein